MSAYGIIYLVTDLPDEFDNWFLVWAVNIPEAFLIIPLAHVFVTFTALSLQALALAYRGIARTRQLALYKKYLEILTGIIIATLVIILVLQYYRVFLYVAGAIFFLGGIGLSILTLKLRSLSSDPRTQQSIAETCARLYPVIVPLVILSALAVILCFALGYSKESIEDDPNIIILYLWAVTRSVIYIWIFKIMEFIAVTNDINKNKNLPEEQATATTEPFDTSQNQNMVTTESQGVLQIMDKDQNVLGEAPCATRPLWLPEAGVQQSDMEPLNWSISLESLIRFLDTCVDTDTWRSLAAIKGESKICMHDINTHFVEPWTHGTGCSVAGLMRMIDQNQGPVQLMISHSWAGSVIETLAMLKSISVLYSLPKTTRVFFCTICMFQPGDNHQSGLTIEEQILLEPFTKIIESKPEYGMHVFHTTIAEVYERLWCVHEINECLAAQLDVYGVFDTTRWNEEKMKSIIKTTNSQNAKCQEKDREKLTANINEQGGFDRLDVKIKRFRRQSMGDLRSAHMYMWLFGSNVTSIDR